MASDRHTAFAGVLTIVVKGAVLVEVAHQLAGDRAQPIGGEPTRESGQLRLGSGPGAHIDSGRQLGHEIPDHRHVLAADLPTSLGRRRTGELRWQGFAGDSPARTQLGGIGDAPAGFGAADPQPLG